MLKVVHPTCVYCCFIDVCHGDVYALSNGNEYLGALKEVGRKVEGISNLVEEILGFYRLYGGK